MADNGQLPAVRNTAPDAALISFDDMAKMADAFAKSNLFGAKTKEQALSLLMIAQAEGIHPALAVMEYDIIEGKPARKAERLLARFQLSGGKVEWKDYTDTKVTGVFSHPMGAAVTVEWTIEAARKITFYKKGQNGDGGKWVPLTDKYNWKSWPRAMLRSRCISEGVRACFPGAALVTLTTEEAQDADVLSVTNIDDTDQTPLIEQSGFIRGAAKDRLVKEFQTRMENARSGPELDGIVEEFRAYRGRMSNNALDGLEEIAAHQAERVADGVPPQSRDASVFQDLKRAGDECADLEALADWAKRLTPARLKQCTEEEVEELRTLYSDKKTEIEGATA